VVEVYRLADELGVSTVEIISAMEKLDIPFQLPNPSVSIDDAQKIKASFKKGSGFSFKNISFFIAAVVSLTFVLSINSDRVFADDTAPPPVATASEPTVSSLLAFKEQVVVASEAIKDSFTVMVQEKLIDLGLLSGPATGINDKVTQEAIKSFQEKAGLEKIDGMVGPETLPKLLQGEAAYTTSATSTSNENGPVWGDDQLQFMRVNGTYMDVLWGHITHDKPIDTFQLYVDGELHTTLDANGCMNSCSSTSGDMRFKINGLAVETTYEFEVVACDSDNNCSSNNPTTTQSTVDKPPVWDESLPLTVSELGTRFNLNIPVGAVTDDVDVAYYEVYVNHALSTYRTISDTRLFVLPKNDMTCGQQEVYIIAYDTIGQSSKSPTTTFTRNECGTTVAASPTTTTTTTTTTLPDTPSITITASEVSDGDTSSDSSLSLTFTTSASTTDFAAGDVSVSGGTLSNFAGSGTTYTATFTPTAQGATTIDVASSTFTNASTGVDNTAATQFNWTYSTAPTMTITAAEVNDGDSSADTSLSVTFTASQSTTNFAAGDVVVSGGTLSNFSGSGTTYTATFTPSAEGATTIDVAVNTFTNAFGTNNTAATQFNWTYVVSQKLATCGDSTTSANRWVVSVIDEDNDFVSPNTVWSSFRSSYPDRCFHLLGPGTYVVSSNLQSSQLRYNGVTWNDEVLAGTAFRYLVNRDNGYTPHRSDWWDLIGADVLPSGAKIALCIDNSGSMTISTVQASVDYFVEQATAAGVTIFAPSAGGFTNYNCTGMGGEDWISGHNVAMD